MVTRKFAVRPSDEATPNCTSIVTSVKISVHTGSDKFSLYPIIRRALAKSGAGLHLKTAGTTWLEEVIGLSHRVLVMRGGRLVSDLAGDAITEGAILGAAFGDRAGPLGLTATELPTGVPPRSTTVVVRPGSPKDQARHWCGGPPGIC